METINGKTEASQAGILPTILKKNHLCRAAFDPFTRKAKTIDLRAIVGIPSFHTDWMDRDEAEKRRQ